LVIKDASKSELLELDGITSEPNAFEGLIFSGNIDLFGEFIIELDDNVLLTESDSLIGDNKRVPNIGTELLLADSIEVVND
jgi:hypothetical protein